MNNSVSSSKNNKKQIIIISLISTFIAICIIFCATFSFYLQRKNDDILDEELEIVIYQYEVVDFKFDISGFKKEIYRKEYSENLKDEIIITSLNGKGTNKVIIENGIIKVVDANCRDHICMNNTISKGNYINNLDIVCMPNGLLITLEEVEK